MGYCTQIGPLSGLPPGSDILPAIQAQINALQKAGEEETEDDNKSTSNTASASSVSSYKSSSSSSSSSTSASSCPSYINTEDDSEQWEGVPDQDDPTIERSHISQNPEHSPQLLSRANTNTYTSVQGCNFPNGMVARQPNFLSAGGFRNLGRRPYIQSGNAGKVFDQTPKWYVAQNTCNQPWFQYYRTPASQQGQDDAPDSLALQSIDHVWETQLVNSFLSYMADGSLSTCDDMNTVFFQYCKNGMQTIFDQLPGMSIPNDANFDISPGFIAVAQRLNNVKDIQWWHRDVNLVDNSREDTVTDKIQSLQDFLMMFELLKDTDVSMIFDVTKIRMYQVFAGVGKVIADVVRPTGSNLSSPLKTDWAQSFKNWMTSHLASLPGPAWTWASNTLAALKNDPSSDPTTNAPQPQLQQLSWIEGHTNWAQDQFSFDFGLTWQEGIIDLGYSVPQSATSSSTTATSSASVAVAPSTSFTSAASALIASAASVISILALVVSIAVAPTGAACNCNEDGCTADSPPCCADGSCV
ncbi:hypothetical protein JMJ35_010185 [Cladonia borealis]|uniref:Uncharacterized protein n=1 Tax=Cladonia borealis TaxID=184061 RepID=A0AA39UXC1_9LECA|nr:hypothetical protein JMJ35_010185 [Cladonia borealis]